MPIGGLNQLGGAQNIDALVAYLARFKSPAAPYNLTNPQLTKPRITPLNGARAATSPAGCRCSVVGSPFVRVQPSPGCTRPAALALRTP